MRKQLVYLLECLVPIGWSDPIVRKRNADLELFCLERESGRLSTEQRPRAHTELHAGIASEKTAEPSKARVAGPDFEGKEPAVGASNLVNHHGCPANAWLSRGVRTPEVLAVRERAARRRLQAAV